MNLPELLDDSESMVFTDLVKTKLLEGEYIGLQSKTNGNILYNLINENLVLEGQGAKITDFYLYYAGNPVLPSPQEKSYFIVSKEVKKENVGRTDLLTPTEYGEKTEDGVFRKIKGLE